MYYVKQFYISTQKLEVWEREYSKTFNTNSHEVVMYLLVKKK